MASPDMQPKPLTELVRGLSGIEAACGRTGWVCLDAADRALVREAADFIQRVSDAAKSEESPGLRIVFDGPPGQAAGRFVEVENADGRSINAGEWRQRSDGLWELVING